MKRLIEHVACRSGDTPVLIQAETVLSAKAVLSRVATARSQNVFLRAHRCQIAGHNDLGVILELLAADGWASEVFLSAAGSEPEKVVAGDPGAGESEPDENQPCDTQFLLATSGTTGDSKWVRHDLASLSRSIRTDPTKGATVRWGLLYDPRRFAGLQVVLQAILGGSSVVVPSDRDDLERTVLEFRQHGVNAISATPSFWRKLLLAGLAKKLDLQIVTLGGEIADEAILKTLQAVFPKARLTHIFASTEAGVGFAVHDGREGFPESFLQRPPQGVDLKVDSRCYLLVRSGSRIVAENPKAPTANPSSEDGHRSHPTPCDEPHHVERDDHIGCYADGIPLADSDGWICTGDLVEKRGDRYCFLGRADEVINVGGDKVHPTEIEDVARLVPGVGLALARAKQSPIVGQVPELLIETDGTTDPTTLKEAVLERCRAELPRVKWPAIVKVVGELPLSDTGKVERK